MCFLGGRGGQVCVQGRALSEGVCVGGGGGLAKHVQTWIARRALSLGRVIACNMCCIPLSSGMQEFCFAMPGKKGTCEHTPKCAAPSVCRCKHYTLNRTKQAWGGGGLGQVLTL